MATLVAPKDGSLAFARWGVSEDQGSPARGLDCKHGPAVGTSTRVLYELYNYIIRGRKSRLRALRTTAKLCQISRSKAKS